MSWILRMTLLVAGIKLVADLYIGWRLKRAAEYVSPKFRVWGGWVTGGFFLLLYLLPVTALIHYMLDPSVDLQSYPKIMVYVFWVGVAFSFQVLAWIVATHLFKLAVDYGFGNKTDSLDRTYGIVVIGVASLIFVYTGIKTYLDTTQIEVETVRIEVEDLPPVLEGFKIVHISDIQADRYTGEEELDRYISLVNEQQPDLVVFTGDLISYGTRYISVATRYMAEIDSRYGVYFVVGDHDYWAGTQNVTQPLRENGIMVLEDQTLLTGPDSARIRLTGVTNVYSRPVSEPELLQLMQDSTGEVKILASHQASGFMVDLAVDKDYDILLGGHTHGGQMLLPLFFTKVSASDLETDYVKGVYLENGLLVNINNGLGFTLAPVRYNARPNISVLELSRN